MTIKPRTLLIFIFILTCCPFLALGQFKVNNVTSVSPGDFQKNQTSNENKNKQQEKISIEKTIDSAPEIEVEAPFCFSDIVWMIVFASLLGIFFILLIIIVQKSEDFFKTFTDLSMLTLCVLACIGVASPVFMGTSGIIFVLLAILVIPLTSGYYKTRIENNPWRQQFEKVFARYLTFIFAIFVFVFCHYHFFRIENPVEIKKKTLENKLSLYRAISVFKSMAKRYPDSKLNDLIEYNIAEPPRQIVVEKQIKEEVVKKKTILKKIPSEYVSTMEKRLLPSNEILENNKVFNKLNNEGGWLFTETTDSFNLIRINYDQPLSSKWGVLSGQKPYEWSSAQLDEDMRKVEVNRIVGVPRGLFLVGIILLFWINVLIFFDIIDKKTFCLEWIASVRMSIYLLIVFLIFQQLASKL